MVKLDEAVRLPMTRQQSTMGSGIVFPVCGLAGKQHLQWLSEREQCLVSERDTANQSAPSDQSGASV